MELRGEKNALPIRDYTLFVNNIPVTPARERKLEGREGPSGSGASLKSTCTRRSNEIRVEAFNGVAMGVAETYVGLPVQQKPRPVKGNLYMLAVGVNVFPALPGSTHLAYAAHDAEELGRAWKTRCGGNYGHTLVHVISDGSADKPDKTTILKALTVCRPGRARRHRGDFPRLPRLKRPERELLFRAPGCQARGY